MPRLCVASWVSLPHGCPWRVLSPGVGGAVVAGALAGDTGAPAVTGDAVDALLWQLPWNELGKTLV